MMILACSRVMATNSEHSEYIYTMSGKIVLLVSHLAGFLKLLCFHVESIPCPTL